MPVRWLIDSIRSSSVPGMSSIVMVFEPGVDPYRGLVQERLTQAVALPNVSKPPLMLQPALVDGVLAVAVAAGELSPGSLVGFMTVFGICARNGILLVLPSLYLRYARGRAPLAVRSLAPKRFRFNP